MIFLVSNSRHFIRNSVQLLLKILVLTATVMTQGCGDSLPSQSAPSESNVTLNKVYYEKNSSEGSPSLTVKIERRAENEVITSENNDAIVLRGSSIEKRDIGSFSYLVLPLINQNEVMKDYGGRLDIDLTFLACVLQDCIRYIVPVIYIVNDDLDDNSKPQEFQSRRQIQFYKDIDKLDLDEFETTIVDQPNSTSSAYVQSADARFNLELSSFNKQGKLAFELRAPQSLREHVCAANRINAQLTIQHCDPVCTDYLFDREFVCHPVTTRNLPVTELEANFETQTDIELTKTITLDAQNIEIVSIKHEENGFFSGHEPTISTEASYTQLSFNVSVNRRELASSFEQFTDNIEVSWCKSDALATTCQIDNHPIIVTGDTNRRPIAHIEMDERVYYRGEIATLTGEKSVDLDSDPLSLNWSLLSQPDGSTVELNVNEAVQAVSIQPTHVGIYIIGLIVSDGGAQSLLATKQIEVGNKTPKLTEVKFVETEIYTNNDISVSLGVQDDDESELDFNYEWFVNNQKISSQIGAMLPSSYFKKHDVVKVEVEVSDGRSVVSGFYEQPILNSPPELVSALPERFSFADYARWEGEDPHFTDFNRYREIKVDDADGDLVTAKLTYGPVGLHQVSDFWLRWLKGTPLFGQELPVNYGIKLSDGEAEQDFDKTVVMVESQRLAATTVEQLGAFYNFKSINWNSEARAYLAIADTDIAVYGITEQGGQDVINKLWHMPWSIPDGNDIIDADFVESGSQGGKEFLIATKSSIYAYDKDNAKFELLVAQPCDKNNQRCFVGFSTLSEQGEKISKIVLLQNISSVLPNGEVANIAAIDILDRESLSIQSSITSESRTEDVSTFVIGNFLEGQQFEIFSNSQEIIQIAPDWSLSIVPYSLPHFRRLIGASSRQASGLNSIIYNAEVVRDPENNISYGTPTIYNFNRNKHFQLPMSLDVQRTVIASSDRSRVRSELDFLTIDKEDFQSDKFELRIYDKFSFDRVIEPSIMILDHPITRAAILTTQLESDASFIYTKQSVDSTNQQHTVAEIGSDTRLIHESKPPAYYPPYFGYDVSGALENSVAKVRGFSANGNIAKSFELGLWGGGLNSSEGDLDVGIEPRIHAGRLPQYNSVVEDLYAFSDGDAIVACSNTEIDNSCWVLSTINSTDTKIVGLRFANVVIDDISNGKELVAFRSDGRFDVYDAEQGEFYGTSLIEMQAGVHQVAFFDIDHDGIEDVFLVQNNELKQYFSVEPGLWEQGEKINLWEQGQYRSPILQTKLQYHFGSGVTFKLIVVGNSSIPELPGTIVSFNLNPIKFLSRSAWYGDPVEKMQNMRYDYGNLVSNNMFFFSSDISPTTRPYTKLIVADYFTGKQIWETPPLKGSLHSTFVQDYSHGTIDKDQGVPFGLAFGTSEAYYYYHLRNNALLVRVPPVANAGPDVTVGVGEQVLHDGSNSYDPDGSIRSYHWSNGLAEEKGEVTYSKVGAYEISLTVVDNNSNVSTDSMIVTVVDKN